MNSTYLISLNVRKGLLEAGADATVGAGRAGRVCGNIIAKGLKPAEINEYVAIISQAMSITADNVTWSVEPFDSENVMWAFVALT